MKKVQRSSFKLNPIAASIVIAMSAQLAPGLAHAGAGLVSKIAAGGQQQLVNTYYANSPSGSVPQLTVDPVTGLPTTTLDPITKQPIMVDSGKALRKFVDTLPGIGVANANNLGQYIPVAQPEKWVDGNGNVTNDDYYEIAAVEYSEQMHSDLPKPTHLRGYVQLMTPGLLAKGVVAKSFTTYDGQILSVVDNPHHLGPMINATSGTAVRVKFTNLLPAGGQLFLPVDATITGAGLGADGKTYYTQNRAEIHLVGGQAPWISAGSPHQWIAPAGVINPSLDAKGNGIALKDARGPSNQNVPDMANPGPGSTTLYFPNAQSARFMFYQDRTSGLTRLNSYAGLAAGYEITDPNEQALINGGSLSGGALATPVTVAAGTIPAQQIPLIIEDKTFVPANISQQDANWDTTKWGQPGDLWFPHVYETNQDPSSVDGLNPVGRWDYGPWFWPIFPAATALPFGLGQASFTPEAYEDTPLVNGTAYPTMTVDATAYRLRFLNASNDRFLNLGLYVADSTVKAPQLDRNGNPMVDASGNPLYFSNTEVKMVPAVAATDGFPASVARDSKGNAIMDSNGFPIQLPLPQYLDTNQLPASGGYAAALATAVPAVTMPTSVPGMKQVSPTILFSGTTRAWPMDSRVGGAPDPTMAGPDFIVIGTDGGLLPAPVDIPSQPITYEQNRRSVTVLNVYGYGLLIGPSERKDTIVDFSKYAGKTLIVYNDAPAPYPFVDGRWDYFSGDPDLTNSGGAYSTQPGYGPNTRTIMQIKVNPGVAGSVTPAAPFNATALATALPKAYAASQPAPIVPESAYNASFGTTDGDFYAHVATGSIAQPTFNFSSSAKGAFDITGVNLITSGGTQNPNGTIVGNVVPGSGTGYRVAPIVNFTFTNGGTCAVLPAATATVDNGSSVSYINVAQGGSGYVAATTAVNLSVPPAGGVQATASATVTNGVVTGFTIINPGSGYKTLPQVTITNTGAGTGTGATAYVQPTYQVTSVTMAPNTGTACTSVPLVTFADQPDANGVISGIGAQATLTTVLTGTTTSNISMIDVRTKTEQELFDNMGRYNSTGGVELPLTSDQVQTTVPLSYIDAPTEFMDDVKPVQVWKLVDNGFWSNSMHFDFVDVQLINRVGWDGTVKAPASDEVGWKDTLKLNPLEDVVIAMRARPAQVPFGLPQSNRYQDPSVKNGAPGSGLGFFAANTVLSLTTDNPPNTVLLQTTTNTNSLIASLTHNYDNEFVWDSAVLGHSEDDFIRPIVYHPTVFAPNPVGSLGASVSGTTVKLTWVDPTPAATSIASQYNEIGYTVTRQTYGYTKGVYGLLPAVTTLGTAVANATSFIDPTIKANTDYMYTVTGFNAAGATPATAVVMSAPATPTGLKAALGAAGAATLTWNVSSTATGYIVTINGVAQPLVTTNSFTTTLTPGTSYTITVQAQKSLGNPVTTVTSTGVATLPAFVDPVAPAITSVVPAAGMTTVNWTEAVTTGVASFTVQRSTTATGPWSSFPYASVAVSNSYSLSNTATGAKAGTNYYYQVIANTGVAGVAGPVTAVAGPVKAQ